MAGHNKWAQIKRKKAANDAGRSRMFVKLSRAISVEAKKAKGDKTAPGLIAAVEKARKANMPNDTIDRAIAKASEAKDMMPVLYEAYGPAGVQLIIEGLTDNNNRTSQELRHLLDTHEGSLGTPGSVMWNFTKQDNEYIAQSFVSIDDDSAEKVEALIEALENHDDVQQVATNIGDE